MLRPIKWLTRELALDARWQLVHATHASALEIAAVAATGAGVVICPGTEANLGDGLCDLPRWLASGAALSVGSDSQVLRNWPEELRWLEYGQRLALRTRNVAAAPGQEGATAARLYGRALAGGAVAAGIAPWGLVRGAHADLLELDTDHDAPCGLPPSHWLDGLVFAAPERAFARTMVAGRWIQPAQSRRTFASVMTALF